MQYDCIIVLGNEMDKAGNLNNESSARINLAINSFNEKLAEILIVCGWDYRNDSEITIAHALESYAIHEGIPANNILTETNSRDTVGDAFFTKSNYVLANNWKKLLVVTSDYHVNRTTEIFRFIYGENFSIDVVGACCFETTEKQTTEKQSTEAFKKTFNNISPGSDLEIYKAMRIRHPFYNGDIYPKI